MVFIFINSDFSLTVTEVISAIRLLHSPVGTTTFRKNRERWAIALKTGGKTIYSADGKEILSDALHPVILPKGSSYSWKCVEPGECIIIDFDAPEEADTLLPFAVTDNSLLIKNFTKTERLLSVNTSAARMEAAYLLYETLLFLLKTRDKKYVPKDKRKILSPAIEYISSQYYDPAISNDSLAALCRISTVYFRKTFADVYGSSPIRYLNHFRIEKAKSMMTSDFESIQQIAESVGYGSIYHFSKMFKQYTGVSPREYKKARH